MSTQTAEHASKVLYTRVAAPIHVALMEVATVADLSTRIVVEALLANKLGLDHPHARAVFVALKKWKGDQT